MRQLFYLLIILNLLLFLWIYQSQQQPEQLQTGHPPIGDLHIVSEDVIQHMKSDTKSDGEGEQESVLPAEQKSLPPAHDLTPGDAGSDAQAAKPDSIPAPINHLSPGKIVTSINGYEVVVPSIDSYPAAVRIFDQLQPPAGVEAYTSIGCGDEKCLFFDVSRHFDAAAKGLFDADQFIERDSAMMRE
jgi:hypothetical protein